MDPNDDQNVFGFVYHDDVFVLILKADTFFEFSDRLESLMAKAYIWR